MCMNLQNFGDSDDLSACSEGELEEEKGPINFSFKYENYNEELNEECTQAKEAVIKY